MLGTTIQNVIYLGDLLPRICAPLCYRLVGQGNVFRFPAGTGDLSLLHSIQSSSGVHTASFAVGTGGVLYPEVEWLGHEADHSSPCSAEVKNAWSCISTLLYASVVWCLIKLRDSFLL